MTKDIALHRRKGRLNMEQKVFYLHVCYSKTQDGISYKNDGLVIMTDDKNMPWLRNELKEDMERYYGVKFRETPVIESMTEISEELFEVLNQNKL